MAAYVYILTNKHNKVFYTGITSDLRRCLIEHKEGISWFTAKYKTVKLVFYERLGGVEDAIAREKRIKNLSHSKKHALISSKNRNWEDLTGTLS